jgi:hypothetical protein
LRSTKGVLVRRTGKSSQRERLLALPSVARRQGRSNRACYDQMIIWMAGNKPLVEAGDVISVLVSFLNS